jgi:hypothetical protein
VPDTPTDHDLQANELQRDIRHGRNNAGNRHRERQPAIAESAAHEVGRRDVIVLVADIPQAREHEKQNGINHDGIRHCEERDGPGPESERRDGDESVSRIQIAADEEPGDKSAETAAAEAPFVQKVKVALAPMRSDEPEPGNKGKQNYKDNQSGPINFRHGDLPNSDLCSATPYAPVQR